MQPKKTPTSAHFEDPEVLQLLAGAALLRTARGVTHLVAGGPQGGPCWFSGLSTPVCGRSPQPAEPFTSRSLPSPFTDSQPALGPSAAHVWEPQESGPWPRAQRGRSRTDVQGKVSKPCAAPCGSAGVIPQGKKTNRPNRLRCQALKPSLRGVLGFSLLCILILALNLEMGAGGKRLPAPR